MFNVEQIELFCIFASLDVAFNRPCKSSSTYVPSSRPIMPATARIQIKTRVRVLIAPSQQNLYYLLETSVLCIEDYYITDVAEGSLIVIIRANQIELRHKTICVNIHDVMSKVMW